MGTHSREMASLTFVSGPGHIRVERSRPHMIDSSVQLELAGMFCSGILATCEIRPTLCHLHVNMPCASHLRHTNLQKVDFMTTNQYFQQESIH